jgi:hypothetical protein
MASRNTTFLRYNQWTAQYTIKAQLRGVKEPVERTVSRYELLQIPDADIQRMADHAMMFPQKDHLVQSHRLHV